MKKLIILSTIAIFTILSSCNKETNISKDLTSELIGTYIGSLSIENSDSAVDARATVKRTDINEIEIHCYSEDFDTSFMQRVFEDDYRVQLCSLDSDFYKEYGHNMMNMNNYMNNRSPQTMWMQHLDNEHNESDEHYGSFNMSNHEFNYSFKLTNESSNYISRFTGTRM